MQAMEKTIEAANTKAGIISGTVNTENAVWATRILEDNEAVVDGALEKSMQRQICMELVLEILRLHTTVHAKVL